MVADDPGNHMNKRKSYESKEIIYWVFSDW
jgi:hypothetical protein